jgi:hypothetical protein
MASIIGTAQHKQMNTTIKARQASHLRDPSAQFQLSDPNQTTLERRTRIPEGDDDNNNITVML